MDTIHFSLTGPNNPTPISNRNLPICGNAKAFSDDVTTNSEKEFFRNKEFNQCMWCASYI